MRGLHGAGGQRAREEHYSVPRDGGDVVAFEYRVLVAPWLEAVEPFGDQALLVDYAAPKTSAPASRCREVQRTVEDELGDVRGGGYAALGDLAHGVEDGAGEGDVRGEGMRGGRLVGGVLGCGHW